MGLNPDETKTITELADRLDEWANRTEPKLPEHIGHISFYGSLLKALDNLPKLVVTLLLSYAPEQLNSIQKGLDDLYEKAKAVNHQRSEIGGEANIQKCQVQAATKRFAQKLRLLDAIVESRREQTEIREKPAETELEDKAKEIPSINIQNSNVIVGDVQSENLQVGDHPSIQKQTKAEETKFSILGWIRKKIYHLVGAIIVAIIAAIVVDILADFGWLDQIKAFFTR